MTLWYSNGGDSLAQLVLTGTFKAAGEADEALTLLEEATDIARADHDAGLLRHGHVPTRFSERMLALFRRIDLPFDHADPEELLYDFTVLRDGGRIVITTEQMKFTALVKILLQSGAEIEMRSKQEHALHGRSVR